MRADPPLPVTHVEDAGRGGFVVDQDGERIAEMTYTRAGEHRIIVDHTWVDDRLRGTGTARRLLDSLVAWARQAGLLVIPLCPYAKAQFDKDPSIRDVLQGPT